MRPSIRMLRSRNPRMSGGMGIARPNVIRLLSGLATGAMLLVAALSGCGGTTSHPAAPRLTVSDCSVQGLHARCGRLNVAEDPATPDGRKISLRVVVLPATTTDRAADPLFYLEGGPGGAATNEATWVAQHFSALNRRHDIVLVDQRGTGGSNPAICSTAGLSGSASEAQLAETIQTCLASTKSQADPRFYTTPLAVDDFDQVRAALGYDKIDLYGVSYGVSSALTYIQRHGAHVRAAVLDSGSLLDAHLLELIPRSAQQALNSLFDRCQASPACDAAYPHLRADFTAVTTRLSQLPIASTVADPTTGGFMRLDLPTFMGTLVDFYLKSAGEYTNFPKDIHAAAGGDWSGVLKLFVSGQTGQSSIQLMAVTIRCSDAWASLDPSRVAAVAPGSPFTSYEVNFATGINAVCKYWPHAVGASGPVTSSAPIVFLNGTTDPVDPPENVADARATMPNSLVVRVNGIGHWQLNFDPTGCLTADTNSFLDQGKLSSPGLWSCAQSLPLPSFAV